MVRKDGPCRLGGEPGAASPLLGNRPRWHKSSFPVLAGPTARPADYPAGSGESLGWVALRRPRAYDAPQPSSARGGRSRPGRGTGGMSSTGSRRGLARSRHDGIGMDGSPRNSPFAAYFQCARTHPNRPLSLARRKSAVRARHRPSRDSAANSHLFT
jgi:hypothetical protein